MLITLRKVNSKSHGFEKVYEQRSNRRKALSSKRSIQSKENYTHKVSFNTHFIQNKIHPFNDGNGRTCKILLDNDNKINLLMRRKLKTNNIK